MTILKRLALAFCLLALTTLSACDREAYGLDLSREAPSTQVVEIKKLEAQKGQPQIYLMIFMWIDGKWVPGWDVPGFNPLLQDSLTECLTGAAYASMSPSSKVEMADGSIQTVDKFQGRCFIINAWPGRSKG